MYETAVQHIIWHHYTARALSLSLSVKFFKKISTSLHLGIWICVSFMRVVCVCACACMCTRVCMLVYLRWTESMQGGILSGTATLYSCISHMYIHMNESCYTRIRTRHVTYVYIEIIAMKYI